MKKEIILQNVEDLNKRKIEIEQIVKRYVQDKSVPLDDRWDLFIQCKMGTHSSMYENPDGINWNEITLIDDFHIDKNQTCDVDWFIERSEELIEEGEDIDIVKVKEWFLREFMLSFENDW